MSKKSKNIACKNDKSTDIFSLEVEHHIHVPVKGEHVTRLNNILDTIILLHLQSERLGVADH